MKTDTVIPRNQRGVPLGSANRLLNMGTLGASLLGGAVTEAVKQSIVSIYSNL